MDELPVETEGALAAAPAPPRCSAITRAGKPCRRTTVAGADPPLCTLHSRRTARDRWGRGGTRPLPPTCSRLTRAGRPCHMAPVPGADPPLCIAHAGWKMPDRCITLCSATCGDGHPCPMPARRGSDPPLCAVHRKQRARLEAGDQPLPERRRCAIIRANGQPCRGWALPGAGPPRCSNHAACLGDRWPVRHPRIRCAAVTGFGVPCRAFAVKGAGPPRCHLHARFDGDGPPLHRPRIHCTASTRAGTPCRCFAVRASDPPRCLLHGGLGIPWRTVVGAKLSSAMRGTEHARTHGFYARKNIRKELESILGDAETTPMDRELAVLQVALQRLQDVFESGVELSTLELARLVEATAAGGRSLTRALLARFKMQPDPRDELLKLMDEARDWINENEDWAVKL